MNNYIENKILKSWFQPIRIAPLISFRIFFGLLMAWGMIRFIQNGWIEKLYVEPKFFFKYYGFEWVPVPDETGLYILVYTILVSALFIALGFFYRLSAIIFFGSFTWLELMDATNYLNHYYLVCLFAFWLIFVPANRAFSLDAFIFKNIKRSHVPAWSIYIFIFQMVLVYTCAGIAKLNYDWLFRAMPLGIWLPEHTDIPVLGYFFQFKWTAYIFSWGGAIYDLSIGWLLLFSKMRPWAYVAVVVFHLMTWMLFNIGLFPIIMIGSTLIFFSADFHERLLGYIGYKSSTTESHFSPSKLGQQILLKGILIYMIIQVVLPFRHWLYPGNVLWTEEGYRFSWRVMLVEKSGSATFHIHDRKNNRSSEIINGQYLTRFQEKQMSIQPDFMIQFAKHLKKTYKNKVEKPEITVDAHVAINGRTSRRFIDSTINLAEQRDNFLTKKWILSYK